MDISSIGSATQSGITVSVPAPASDPNPSALPSSTPTVKATQNTTPTSPVADTQHEPSASEVNQAVQKINAAKSIQSQGLEFSVDSTSHRIVVKVVDQQTNQVIRQIPSKEALAIADSLDQTQGLLIKQQA